VLVNSAVSIFAKVAVFISTNSPPQNLEFQASQLDTCGALSLDDVYIGHLQETDDGGSDVLPPWSMSKVTLLDF
jgi:hypothetical protein